MAYDVANPPIRVAGGVAGTSIWMYSDADVDSDVIAQDYFTDGLDLGIKVGDFLILFDTAGKGATAHFTAVASTGTLAVFTVIA